MPSVYEDILNKLKSLEKDVKSLTCCPEAIPYTPTSSSDSYGREGQIAYDDNYFYIKTSAGWKRISLSTF